MTTSITACPTNYPPSGIVSPPQSVNISLNEIAQINCTAIATFINWKVDGKIVDDLRNEGIDSFDDTASAVHLGENLLLVTLRVKGSPYSNNVNVTCVAILSIGGDHTEAFSEPALLRVLGQCLQCYWACFSKTVMILHRSVGCR